MARVTAPYDHFPSAIRAYAWAKSVTVSPKLIAMSQNSTFRVKNIPNLGLEEDPRLKFSSDCFCLGPCLVGGLRRSKLVTKVKLRLMAGCAFPGRGRLSWM